MLERIILEIVANAMSDATFDSLEKIEDLDAYCEALDQTEYNDPWSYTGLCA